jgi:hypothetical protein
VEVAGIEPAYPAAPSWGFQQGLSKTPPVSAVA